MQKVRSTGPSTPASVAAIYVRVSTPDQATSDRTSLAWQESACRGEAARQGLAVVAVYSEQISGAILTRPELQRALSDLEAGKFHTLIIADLSRYSRERGGQENIVARIHAAGGRLVSCDVGAIDPNNPESELQRWIRGDIDAYERLRTRARTKRGSLEQARSGRQPCRRFAPLGYHILTTKDEVRGYVVIDDKQRVVRPGEAGTYTTIPSEVKIVEQIFQLYNGGLTLNELTEELNRQGLKTRGGKPWTRSTVQVILHSRNYIGEATYGRRQCARNAEGKRQHTKRAPEDVVIIPIPPIIDRTVWEAAQERCAANTRKSGNPGRRWLLSGLCHCGICSAKINSRTSRKTQYYTCWPAQSYKSPSHAYHRTSAEALVLSTIAAVALREEHLSAAITWAQDEARRASSQQDGLATLGTARERVQKLQDRQRATVSAQIAGMAAGISAQVYQEQLEAVAADLLEARRIENELLATLAAPIPTINPTFVAQQMSATLRDVESLIRSADPAEASLILAGIIQDITLYRGDTPAVERVVVKFAPLTFAASPNEFAAGPNEEYPMIQGSYPQSSDVASRSLSSPVLTVQQGSE